MGESNLQGLGMFQCGVSTPPPPKIPRSFGIVSAEVKIQRPFALTGRRRRRL